jgi:hypothetical protein
VLSNTARGHGEGRAVDQVAIAVDRKTSAPLALTEPFRGARHMSTFIHAVGTHIATVFARGLDLPTRLHETIIEVRTQRAILEAELVSRPLSPLVQERRRSPDRPLTKRP